MRFVLSSILLLNVIAVATSITVLGWKPKNLSPGLYWYKVYPADAYSANRQHHQRLRGYAKVIAPTHLIARGQYRAIKRPKYRKKYRDQVKSVRPILHQSASDQHRPESEEDKPWLNIVSGDADEPQEELQQDDFFPPVVDEESFASFGKESHTRKKALRKPQEWTTPAPPEDLESTFKPIQMYFQVRQTNQVKHLPQSEAAKDATTLEELLNAPRLKELLKTTRVREVYSEEGYEDAGYDHGGHVRHAEHDEAYAARDEGLFKIEEKVKKDDYTVPDLGQESSEKPETSAVEEETPQESKMEPRITQSRSVISKTAVEYVTLSPAYDGDRKYSGEIQRGKVHEGSSASTQSSELDFWASPTTYSVFAGVLPVTEFSSHPPGPTSATTIEPRSDSTGTAIPRTRFVKILSASDEPSRAGGKMSYVNSSNFAGNEVKKSKERARGVKYSRLHSKYPKRDRFRLAKLNGARDESKSDRKVPVPGTEDDQRIILPTIGYINSLTTAHFGGDGNVASGNEDTLKTVLNITEALKYLRSNAREQRRGTSRRSSRHKSVSAGPGMTAFEPKKIRIANRNRRGLTKPDNDDDDDDDEDDEQQESTEEEEEEENNDDGDEKNSKIGEEEKERAEAERVERERYEKELRDELESKEREIIDETFGKFGPKGEVVSAFKEMMQSTAGSPDEDHFDATFPTTTKPVNTAKYPFYFSKKVHEYSPLRYATDPRAFPRKTGGRMEFYDSRDKMVQCPDSSPNLEDLPKKDTTLETEGGNHSRFQNLGGRIDCMKKKYFDEDPFDNPLFKETDVEPLPTLIDKNDDGVHSEKPNRTTVRKERNSSYSASQQRGTKDRRHRGNRGRNESEKKRTNSNYSAGSNRPDSIAKPPGDAGSAGNGTEKGRVIPVTEQVDETLHSDHRAAYNTTISGLTPPSPRRNVVRRPTPSPPPLPSPITSKLKIKHNCMGIIGKVAAMDNSRNLIIDCNDALLMQEIINDVRYLKVIPKLLGKEARQRKAGRRLVPSARLETSDWIPMSMYPPPMTRKLSQVQDELPDNQDHYLITELKEEDGVRRGEVVEDKAEESSTVATVHERTAGLTHRRQHGRTQQDFGERLRTGDARTLSHRRRAGIRGDGYIRNNRGLHMVYLKRNEGDRGAWILASALGGGVRKRSRPTGNGFL